DLERLDAFMTDQSTRIDQTRLDVFFLQPGVALQQDLGRVASCEHSEHVFDRKPTPAHDGLAAEDVRIHRDAFEEFLFVHCCLTQSTLTGLQRTGTSRPRSSQPPTQPQYQLYHRPLGTVPRQREGECPGTPVAFGLRSVRRPE